MARAIHEIKGFAIVLDKVVFLTRVFTADGDEGYQFNVRFSGDTRLSLQYPTRHEADLERKLLIEALKAS